MLGNRDLLIGRQRDFASRRGAILPLVAVTLPVMLIFLGFSVDLAYMQNTRMELRAATDAAARAAATRLSQTDDPVEARRFGRQIARRNFVAGERLRLQNSDIEIGRSTPDAAGRWLFDVGGSPPNAVRVVGHRLSSSNGGAVSLFFGGLVGHAEFEPVQTATASFLNVDICLVLDRSTSMKLNADSSESGMYISDARFCSAPTNSSRWMALDNAIQVFVETLQDSNADEQVALVTYSSDLSAYGSLCGAFSDPSSLDSPLDTDLSRIETEMNRLSTSTWNGNTYIESGMRKGIDALTDPTRSRKFANKVMIVLTDGHENEGSALSVTTDTQAENIIVNTITFGDFADRTTMASVATAGGGRHYHASDSVALEEVFRELAAEVAQITD
ncbi:MAG: VWA domain-containing protein [Planctomycetota bacterium]